MACFALVQGAIGRVHDEGKLILQEYAENDDEDHAISLLIQNTTNQILAPCDWFHTLVVTSESTVYMLNRLMEWRDKLRSGGGGGVVSGSSSTSTTTKIERVDLAADMMYALLVLCVLRATSENILLQLRENSTLESIVQMIVATKSAISSPPAKEVLRRTHELHMDILSHLCGVVPFWLDGVLRTISSGWSAKTEKEISNQVRLLRIVKCDTPGLRPSIVNKMLTSISELVAKIHGKGEVKQLLCETVYPMLLPALRTKWMEEALRDTATQEVLAILYQNIERWTQKPKHTLYAIPALCSVAGCRTSMNLKPLFDIVLQLATSNKKHKGTYQECALHLLGVHMTFRTTSSAAVSPRMPRHTRGADMENGGSRDSWEDSDSDTSALRNHRTTSIDSSIGPSDEVLMACFQYLVKSCKTTLAVQISPALPSSLDLILLVVRADVVVGVQLIMDLFCENADGITEGSLLGLHALLILCRAMQPSVSSPIPASWWVLGPTAHHRHRSPFSSYVTLQPLIVTSSLYSSQYDDEDGHHAIVYVSSDWAVSGDTIQKALMPFAAEFSRILSHFLALLEKDALKPPTKSAAQIEKDKIVNSAFQICLLLLPYIRPSGLSALELCEVLSHVWYHRNPNFWSLLKLEVLPHFMLERPNLRETLLVTLCTDAIPHVDDPIVTVQTLRLLNRLLLVVSRVGKEIPSVHLAELRHDVNTVTQTVPDCIEGLCVALLCHTSVEVRYHALIVLETLGRTWVQDMRNIVQSRSFVFELFDNRFHVEDLQGDTQGSLYKDVLEEKALRPLTSSPSTKTKQTIPFSMRPFESYSRPHVEVVEKLLSTSRMEGVLRVIGYHLVRTSSGTCRFAFQVLKEWLQQLFGSTAGLRMITTRDDISADVDSTLTFRWLNVVSLGACILRRDIDTQTSTTYATEWLALMAKMLKSSVVDVVECAAKSLSNVPLLFGTGVMATLRAGMDEMQFRKDKEKRRGLLLWYCVLIVSEKLVERGRADSESEIGVDIATQTISLVTSSKEYIMALPASEERCPLAHRLRVMLCKSVKAIYSLEAFQGEGTRSQRGAWIQYFATYYRYEVSDVDAAACQAMCVLLDRTIFLQSTPSATTQQQPMVTTPVETDRPFVAAKFLSWVDETFVHKVSAPSRRSLGVTLVNRVVACHEEVAVLLLDKCFDTERFDVYYTALATSLLSVENAALKTLKILSFLYCCHSLKHIRSSALTFLAQTGVNVPDKDRALEGTVLPSVLFPQFAFLEFELKNEVLNYTLSRVHACDERLRSLVLSLLLAFLPHFQGKLEMTTVIPAFAEITAKYSESNTFHVSELWGSLWNGTTFSEGMRVLFAHGGLNIVESVLTLLCNGKDLKKREAWVRKLCVELVSLLRIELFLPDQSSHGHPLVKLLLLLPPFAGSLGANDDPTAVYLIHLCVMNLDHEQVEISENARKSLIALCSMEASREIIHAYLGNVLSVGPEGRFTAEDIAVLEVDPEGASNGYQAFVEGTHTVYPPTTAHVVASHRSYLHAVVGAIVAVLAEGKHEKWSSSAMTWIQRSYSEHDVLRSLQVFQSLSMLDMATQGATIYQEWVQALVKTIVTSFHSGQVRAAVATSQALATLTSRNAVTLQDRPVGMLGNTFWVVVSLLLVNDKEIVRNAMIVLRAFISIMNAAALLGEPIFSKTIPSAFSTLGTQITADHFSHILLPFVLKHAWWSFEECFELAIAVCTASPTVPLGVLIYFISSLLPALNTMSPPKAKECMSSIVQISIPRENDALKERACRKDLSDAFAIGDIGAVTRVVQAVWFPAVAESIVSHHLLVRKAAGREHRTSQNGLELLTQLVTSAVRTAGAEEVSDVLGGVLGSYVAASCKDTDRRFPEEEAFLVALSPLHLDLSVQTSQVPDLNQESMVKITMEMYSRVSDTRTSPMPARHSPTTSVDTTAGGDGRHRRTRSCPDNSGTILPFGDEDTLCEEIEDIATEISQKIDQLYRPIPSETTPGPTKRNAVLTMSAEELKSAMLQWCDAVCGVRLVRHVSSDPPQSSSNGPTSAGIGGTSSSGPRCIVIVTFDGKKLLEWAEEDSTGPAGGPGVVGGAVRGEGPLRVKESAFEHFRESCRDILSLSPEDVRAVYLNC
eukprot:PhF_6_TR44158/c0_g1_i3/m.67598